VIAAGIDLGTTYSALAVLTGGEPCLIPNEEGNRTTPSVVYVTAEGQLVVGDDAVQLMATDRKNGLALFKRGMGSSVSYPVRGLDLTPVVLSSEILKQLAVDFQSYFGSPLREAVVTVPAYFNEHARLDTQRAAELAGISLLELIHEPTAAAVAYGMDTVRDSRTVLVYDLGGGTFDVSVVRFTTASATVVSTLGDPQLGGADWDAVLAEIVADRFAERHGHELRSSASAYGLLSLQAEKAKRRLTAHSSTTVECGVEGIVDQIEVTRSEFEDATQHLAQRTIDILMEALGDAKLKVENLDEIILVGGSTRMPICTQLIQRAIGKSPLRTINPDEAVAIGAATRAEMLSGGGLSLREPTQTTHGVRQSGDGVGRGHLQSLSDVTAHSLGMVTINSAGTAYVNDVMIRRLSKLPTRVRHSKLFEPASAGKDLAIYLLQGESAEPTNTTALGQYTFSDVASQLPRGGQIDIIFGYDKSGVVTIEAEVGNKRLPAPEVDRSDLDLSWTLDTPGAPPPAESSASTLLFDCSGSMSSGDKAQAISAGREFIDELKDVEADISIIAWGSSHQVLCEPTSDMGVVKRELERIASQDLGGTNLAQPLSAARALLSDSTQSMKLAVVLTDGHVADAKECFEVREQYIEEGIDILGLGVNGADEAFLRDLSTIDVDSFITNLSALGGVFRGIAQDIAAGHISASRRGK